ncbi:CRISPR-associated endoribonuclease Cas6 [Campylobacter fetus]|uniref:CRISPR-associated endoribonuclease Cas6 n=1 Tax=Campylobacter fetus TaxID=196 RepID=UPI00070E57B9|nr:CRISPR-associated endoribonuclease Cas6 [Campylobacter fetus]
MKIYQLKVFLKLNQNVDFVNSPEFLSSNLHKSMLGDEALRSIHMQRYLKPYSIGFLYGMKGKKDGFTSGEDMYFYVRSIDESFISKLRICLENSKNLGFNVYASKLEVLDSKRIDCLYTMSPATVVLKEGDKTIPWRRENSDIAALKDALILNLKNKYEFFLDKKIEITDDIIELIEIKTNRAFAFKYKNGKIYAYRYQIHFSGNKTAQEFANIAMILGVGVKNTLGFGFCMRSKNVV